MQRSITTIAMDPRSEPYELRELAVMEDPDIREAIAGNEATPQDVLERLAHARSKAVRFKVASNPSTPARVLDLLGDLDREGSELVRHGAAANPSTPVTRLRTMIATDRRLTVFCAVANNPACPPDVLELLMHVPPVAVQRAIARNPRLPRVLAKQLLDRADEDIYRALAANPAVDAWLLAEICERSSSPDVIRRIAAKENPNAPEQWRLWELFPTG